jgi:polyhydroxyalkanoate synthesis regulator phasin
MAQALLNVVRETTILSVLFHLIDQQGLYAGLLTIPHTKEAMIPNANSGSALAPAFEVCGKQYPLTNKITTILKSVDGTLKNYGERVKEYEGEQVDWKALSHAIRITEQILELCGTGKLTFPRPNAQFLLDVKSGKLTLDEATNYLNDAFSKVDDAIATSILQEKTPELTAKFREWKVEVLSNLYGI